MNKPELLSPAGNLDILKIAIKYGADAIYCGTPAFAMRARVGFDLSTLKEGIEFAHKKGKKVYVTLNAFPHALDIDKMKEHIDKLIALAPDAFIVADPGLIEYLKSITDIPLHLSTQANTTNQLSANFWHRQGVERIVLARELSLEEIAKIHQESKVEIECFIHGAMCMAYSGRCQISNYLTSRDPNQGQCIQACRFKYKIYELEEDLREGERFPIYEDEEGTHLLNSKDLCMIKHLGELIEAGAISLKIEGRLKTEYYVASVTKAYRQAIDDLFADRQIYEKNLDKYFTELEKTSNRGFTTGFYLGKPTDDANNYERSKATSEWGYIGRVLGYDSQNLTFECKNHLLLGQTLELITPTGLEEIKLTKMTRGDEEVAEAHSGNNITITHHSQLADIDTNSLLRAKL
jgi:putative protease